MIRMQEWKGRCEIQVFTIDKKEVGRWGRTDKKKK